LITLDEGARLASLINRDQESGKIHQISCSRSLARLRTIAEKDGLSFNDILQSYVIERFLARLARSAHADTVLLNGALMLRVWGVPRARPTMDIDLLRRGNAEEATLVALVRDCAAMVDESDGVTFDARTIVAESIRDGTSYVGTRIRLVARLDNVRQIVQIDFGVGDAVHPQPATIHTLYFSNVHRLSQKS
jgi:hypothetical protein